MGVFWEIACGSSTAAKNMGDCQNIIYPCWKDQPGNMETRKKKLPTAAAAKVGRFNISRPHAARTSHRVGRQANPPLCIVEAGGHAGRKSKRTRSPRVEESVFKHTVHNYVSQNTDWGRNFC